MNESLLTTRRNSEKEKLNQYDIFYIIKVIFSSRELGVMFRKQLWIIKNNQNMSWQIQSWNSMKAKCLDAGAVCFVMIFPARELGKLPQEGIKTKLATDNLFQRIIGLMSIIMNCINQEIVSQ